MLIHADADAFFASVEARDDPALLGYAQATFGAKGFDVDRLVQVQAKSMLS